MLHNGIRNDLFQNPPFIISYERLQLKRLFLRKLKHNLSISHRTFIQTLSTSNLKLKNYYKN